MIKIKIMHTGVDLWVCMHDFFCKSIYDTFPHLNTIPSI